MYACIIRFENHTHQYKIEYCTEYNSTDQSEHEIHKSGTIILYVYREISNIVKLGIKNIDNNAFMSELVFLK